MKATYYDTRISETVRHNGTSKIHRIRKHDGVPYITFKRKTRVLFKSELTGAFVNVNGDRVYFL